MTPDELEDAAAQLAYAIGVAVGAAQNLAIAEAHLSQVTENAQPPIGSVITFSVPRHVGPSPLAYAAIRHPSGDWWVTGALGNDSRVQFGWGELITVLRRTSNRGELRVLRWGPAPDAGDLLLKGTQA